MTTTDLDRPNGHGKEGRPIGSPLERRLTEFLLAALKRSGFNEVEEITLQHVPSRRDGEIGSWSRDRDSEMFVIGNIGRLVNVVLETAEQNAEGVGTHHFELRCIDHRGRPLKTRFAIEGDAFESDYEVSRDGVLALVMRHEQISFRAALEAPQAALRSMREQLDMVTAENVELRKERRENLKLLESALSKQHERNLETEQAKAARAERAKIADNIITTLRIVGGNILQKKGMIDDLREFVATGSMKPSEKKPAAAEDATPTAQQAPRSGEPPLHILCAEFVGSLTDEQRAALDGVLRDEQKALLMKIVASTVAAVNSDPNVQKNKEQG